jgi:hypothetical protein
VLKYTSARLVGRTEVRLDNLDLWPEAAVQPGGPERACPSGPARGAGRLAAMQAAPGWTGNALEVEGGAGRATHASPAGAGKN